MFSPTEPPKSLERREKRSKENKEFLAGEKNKELQRTKERKDRVLCVCEDPGGVRARFCGEFQAVKVPIFGGFPVANPTSKAIVMPKSSESDILAKFFRRHERKMRRKKWRNVSPIFVLQFPGKVVARNFTKNWRQIRLVVK